MAKEKVTVTLDRSKAECARSLVSARSTSEVLDLALDRLIASEGLRRDIDAYSRVPPTGSEVVLASYAEMSGLDDDTDWEELYADGGG